jgi:hypothetical protein
MLVGYNTNISHKKKVFHVQTEDSGQDNPVIITLLYHQGAILASKKTSYEHLLKETELKERVRKLMQEQHKQMIRELISGTHDGQDSRNELDAHAADETVEEKEPAERIPNSLDDVLLNYIMKRTNK